MSEPIKFFIGRWDPRGFPLKPGTTIQVAVTADKRWDESFEVIEATAYDAVTKERDEIKKNWDELPLWIYALTVNTSLLGGISPLKYIEQQGEYGLREWISMEMRCYGELNPIFKIVHSLFQQLAAERARADDLVRTRALARQEWGLAIKEREALAEKLKSAEAEIARIRRDGRELNMRLENENIAYFNALQEITEEGHTDCEYCLKHDRIASQALGKHRCSEAQK